MDIDNNTFNIPNMNTSNMNISNINFINNMNNVFCNLMQKYKINIDTKFSCYAILFSSNFIYNHAYKSNTPKQYIQHKYNVLKHYLFSSNVTIKDKKSILKIFGNIQKNYFALLKFKNIIYFKQKQIKSDAVDLNFTPLEELPKKYIITLIENNDKFQFNILDLIRIINTSLSYDDHFFPEPYTPKNPWNNKSFSIHNLYNIYFFILELNIPMPILFQRYFQSNFNLIIFSNNNQFIIRDYIIKNSHLLNKTKKANIIYDMISFYNSTFNCMSMFISKYFPEDKLIIIFERYIKTYLHAKYSYESAIRISYTNKLIKKIRKFLIENPCFARYIAFKNIKKLFFISHIYYNFYKCKGMMYFNSNIYIPHPSMILIQKKGYLVDYQNINHHSIFLSSLKKTKPVNISQLFNQVNKYSFNEKEKKYIDDELINLFNKESKIKKNKYYWNNYIRDNYIYDDYNSDHYVEHSSDSDSDTIATILNNNHIYVIPNDIPNDIPNEISNNQIENSPQIEIQINNDIFSEEVELELINRDDDMIGYYNDDNDDDGIDNIDEDDDDNLITEEDMMDEISYNNRIQYMIDRTDLE